MWVYGTVADEPTIRGGWILDEHRTAERENGTSAQAPERERGGLAARPHRLSV